MLSSNWAMFRFHLSLYLGSRPMPQQLSGLAPPWTLTSRPWMPSTTSWLKSWRRERGITSTKSGYPASGSNGDTNLQTSFHNMHANPMNLFIPQGPLPSQVVGKSWKSHERFHLRVPQQHLTKTYNIKFTCAFCSPHVYSLNGFPSQVHQSGVQRSQDSVSISKHKTRKSPAKLQSITVLVKAEGVRHLNAVDGQFSCRRCRIKHLVPQCATNLTKFSFILSQHD